MVAKTPFHYAPQPNCRFNSDAKAAHGFAIFKACFDALRPPAPVNLGVERPIFSTTCPHNCGDGRINAYHYISPRADPE